MFKKKLSQTTIEQKPEPHKETVEEWEAKKDAWERAQDICARPRCGSKREHHDPNSWFSQYTCPEFVEPVKEKDA